MVRVKKTARFLFIICMLLFMVTACGEAPKLPDKDAEPTPSTEKADAEAYYGLKDGELLLVTNGVQETERGLLLSDGVYIPYSVAAQWDDRLYWNEAEEELIVSNAEGLYRYWPGVTRAQEKDEFVETEKPQLLIQDGTLYVAYSLVARFCNIRSQVLEAPGRVVAYADGATLSAYTVTDAERSQLRTEGDVTTPILAALPAGEKVYAAEAAGDGGWVKATTADGLTGYIQKEALGNMNSTTVESGFSEPEYKRLLLEDEVRLVWHQIFSEQGGGALREALDDVSGINVICPTWFKITAVDGSVTSLASASYVEAAHEMGLQVWGLVDDFTPGVPGYEVLSGSESRANLIGQLVAEIKRVGADGINIDFEYITRESVPHYMQFLRELYLACREESLVLSVDNYVPDSSNGFYQLENQKDVADYVIVMTYDEHHSKSEEAGSTASIEFVEQGAAAVLAQLPKEQVLLGLPFFARKWMTTTAEDGTVSVTSEAGGMQGLRDFAKENGAEWVWNDICKQYYTEFTAEGVFYQIWLEDATSLSYKIKIMQDSELAGFACWKLGLETSDVWEVLSPAE